MIQGRFGMRFLIFTDHTVECEYRSGIQRVVIELVRSLGARATVDLVKWDEQDGQLRFLDSDDLGSLARLDKDLRELRPNQFCQRVRYRFSDVIDDPAHTWLIFPEIAYHTKNGNEKFARIITQCREYGVRVASVFYDLIPLLEADYIDLRSPHAEYVLELLRSDLIVPISHYSATELSAYYSKFASAQGHKFPAIESRIRAVPLGEEWSERRASTARIAAESSNPKIILHGTIEPRKQQARVLRILNDLAASVPMLAAAEIFVFGSLHPLSKQAFEHELERNSRIHYRSYVSDEELQDAYVGAWFSVFASRSEGFGLPISESLAFGVPCLTANFGSMAEVAAPGGCLTVDMLSDEAIAKGLLQLCSEASTRLELRKDIEQRRARPWDAYAADFVDLCETYDQRERDRISGFSASVESLAKGEGGHISVGDMEWTIVGSQADYASQFASPPIRSDRSSGARATAFALPDDLDLRSLGDKAIRALLQADVIATGNREVVNDLADLANEMDYSGLLPSDIVVESGEARRVSDLAALAGARAAIILRRRAIGQCENEYDVIASAMKREYAMSEPDLAIVISTYNRGPFVERNVEWLLLQNDTTWSESVRIVVVDNASTDDTQDMLNRFLGHPCFTYIRNANNVGMLGNLNVCSTLQVAKYVWMIGDDDFILPDAVMRVRRAISDHPRIALLAHNFGIYHREKLGSTDTVPQLISELQPVAPKSVLYEPFPSGVIATNVMAGAHDNLFTAIYPLVFRSDILSACFNYPFTGTPFGTLVECVPTSKMILESLCYCEVYWFFDHGIVGNAHNSWAHHRPRWHLVNMAQVFDLARSGGVDEERLWGWARWHVDLFKEGIEIARQRSAKVHLEDPIDFDEARRIYRTRIEVPQGIDYLTPPPVRAPR